MAELNYSTSPGSPTGERAALAAALARRESAQMAVSSIESLHSHGSQALSGLGPRLTGTRDHFESILAGDITLVSTAYHPPIPIYPDSQGYNLLTACQESVKSILLESLILMAELRMRFRLLHANIDALSRLLDTVANADIYQYIKGLHDDHDGWAPSLGGVTTTDLLRSVRSRSLHHSTDPPGTWVQLTKQTTY
jgi:hypothetical protein